MLVMNLHRLTGYKCVTIYIVLSLANTGSFKTNGKLICKSTFALFPLAAAA